MRVACGVLKEYEVQVRSVAEFHAAELAVARDRDARGARGVRFRAHRLAMDCDRLLPGDRERLFEDQLGDVGQPVADLHQRQPSRQVEGRDAEHGGAAEVAQCIHLQLRVAARMLEPRGELALELAAIRQRLEHAGIEQLVEQQRVRRDLARQVFAHAADPHQARQRRRVLVQQREVSSAAADRFDDAQDPCQHDLGGGALAAGSLRDGRQQARQQCREPAAAMLVEAPVIAGLAQLQQHARGFCRLADTEGGHVVGDTREYGLCGPQ